VRRAGVTSQVLGLGFQSQALEFRFSRPAEKRAGDSYLGRDTGYMSVNFTGIWKANLSRSRFLGAQSAAVTAKIEHSDPELRAEMVVTKADGGEERVVFQCWTNGEQDKSLLNGRAVRGNARWEGEELVIESWMQMGTRELHFCDYWSLSRDDQTLSMEHRNDDLAGQLTVLDRAGEGSEIVHSANH
jgi:hypothetical protein